MRLAGERGLSPEELVDQALPQALAAMPEDTPLRECSHTTPASLGRCLAGDVDNVSEALTIADGEAYR